MNVSMEQQAILAVYPNSASWRYKVLNKFSQSQIIAVYLSFKQRGLIQ